MAQLLRSQPPKPHLSGPVVAPGGPVIAAATIALDDSPHYSNYPRRGCPRPHVAGPIVGIALARLPGATTITESPALRAVHPRRGAPKPHSAPSLIGIPEVYLPAAIHAGMDQGVSARQFQRVKPPKPHTTSPIVAPGGPVIPGSIFRRLVTIRWSLYRPHHAPPLMTAPVVPPVVVRLNPILITAKRAVERRGAPKPHVVSGQIQPSGGNPLPSNVRTGLFIDPARFKLPRRPLVNAVIGFTQPVIAAATTTFADKFRVLIGRATPKPHRAPTISAPGGPVIPGQNVNLVTTDKRTLVLRNPPRPHLAPRTLTQPAPTNPLPPAVVVSQTKRRPYVGRTTPRPHYSRPNLAQPRLRPGLFASQVRPRMHIGRTVPKPHVAPDVVTPVNAGVTPLPPTILVGQAKARALVGRTRVFVTYASPLAAVPPAPNLLEFVAEMWTARWAAYVGEPRWTVGPRPLRWHAHMGQPRWSAEMDDA